MKKYKVTFSFFNLFNASSEEVVKLQNLVKSLNVTVCSITYIAANANYVILVGAVGVVIDTLLSCLYFEKQE